MSDTIPDRLGRAARVALRTGTAPVRALARAAIRRRPALEPRLAGQAWLWQPGWGRSCHERLYRHPDPFDAATSSYEQAKHDLIMRTLGAELHLRVLEVGCGEGVLSERLVTLTGDLVAVDISDTAIGRARTRLGDDDRVRFERRTLPFDMPDGMFDLIVCADVLHLWDASTLATGLDRLLDRLRPGGRLVLLHHLGDVGQAGRGDSVHDLAIRVAGTRPGLCHLAGTTVPDTGPGHAGLRLDVITAAVTPEPEYPALFSMPEQRNPEPSAAVATAAG